MNQAVNGLKQEDVLILYDCDFGSTMFEVS